MSISKEFLEMSDSSQMIENFTEKDFYDEPLMEVGCLNPVLIVNPSALEIALKSDKYFIDGVSHEITSDIYYRLLNNVDSVSKILGIPYVENLSDEFKSKHSTKEVRECEHRLARFLSDSFFLLEDGSCEPMYIYVSCGHCDCCLNRKLTSYVQRAQMAVMESMRPALFVTLTYNDASLPSDGVCKRDVQLFKKKLKRLLDSRHYDGSALKFLVFSEYGKLGRPHYHMLIFGWPELSKNVVEDDYLTHKFIQYSWRLRVSVNGSMFSQNFDEYLDWCPKAYYVKFEDDIHWRGYVNISRCDRVNTAVAYVAKYMSKENGNHDNVPDGKNPNFVSVSQNLGVKFVQDNFDPENPFRFCGLDGVMHEINLCGYYLKKVLPSVSELIHPDVRHAARGVLWSLEKILHSDYPDFYKNYCFNSFLLFRPIIEFLGLFNNWDSHLFDGKTFSYFYFVDDRAVDIEYVYRLDEIECFIDMLNILDVFCQNFDFDGFLEKVKNRSVYFGKMKSRTRGQLNDVASSYRKSLIVNQSNVKL